MTVVYKIDFNGEWSGTLGSETSSKSVSGIGKEKYESTGQAFSASIQKEDDSDDVLTVEIYYDNELVKTASTSAPFGIATVSYSAF